MLTINADTLRERVRERGEEPNWQLCGSCDSGLSADDLEFAECSNCGATLDVNDESVSEDLWGD